MEELYELKTANGESEIRDCLDLDTIGILGPGFVLQASFIDAVGTRRFVCDSYVLSELPDRTRCRHRV